MSRNGVGGSTAEIVENDDIIKSESLTVFPCTIYTRAHKRTHPYTHTHTIMNA